MLHRLEFPSVESNSPVLTQRLLDACATSSPSPSPPALPGRARPVEDADGRTGMWFYLARALLSTSTMAGREEGRAFAERNGQSEPAKLEGTQPRRRDF
nr:unnamed protein product [Digitaria exilis]